MGKTAKALVAAFVGALALAGCAPREDACQASGYDPGVCAGEQSRRAAALAILGGMRQQQPYQLPMPQQPAPYQIPVQPQTHCTSMPNGAGGFYTNCY